MAKIEKSDYEYWTKVNFRTTLKRFYKWHLGNDEEYPEVVRWIRTKNGGRAREKLPTDLLSPEEIEKLLEACAHPRDKALVSLLYDSGCRISEILTLRWGHITFESWGAALTVHGKTGTRRVVVVGNSIPYLLAWKEIHPLGGQPEAPVFVGQNAAGSKQGGADEAMNYASARRVIKMAAEHAGLRKRIHPHLFRHTRATELAKRVTKHRDHAHLYQARAEVCNACPVKSSCTESRKGRTILRPFDQAYIERVRLYHETVACRSAISKRKVWVEPLFAEAKTLHGLRRFRLRGIEKVNMEGLMTAAGQNIKRLIRQQGARSPSHSVPSLAALSIRLLSSLFHPASAKQPQSFALVP